MAKKWATVIGGGVQGCTIALKLNSQGYNVNIVDRNGDLFMGASLNQEGKVHTGMIYALDDTMKTAHKIIEDAVLFAPYIEELVGKEINWHSLSSPPFHYLVHHESLISADALRCRYTEYEEIFTRRLRDSSNHYLGERSMAYFRKVELPEPINSELFSACFLSCERAVDPKSIGNILVAAIRSRPNIRVFLNHEVHGIKRTINGFDLCCRTPEEQNCMVSSDIVINSSWDQKRYLDSMLGISYIDPWSLRYKIGFILEKQRMSKLPTFVIVQGPFGDFVEFPNQDYTYFSWYPSCRIGVTNKIQVPENWKDLQNRQFDGIPMKDIKDQSLSALRMIMPELTFKISGIKGGTIVAYGEKEIDQIGSKLHKRSEVAVTEHDGYFSINSSKFTSAPNNAFKLGRILSN